MMPPGFMVRFGSMAAPLSLRRGASSRWTRTDTGPGRSGAFDVTGEPDIRLATFDGPISVRGWDRDEVYVEIEKRGRETGQRSRQIEVVSRPERAVSIRSEARQPGGEEIRVRRADDAVAGGEDRWRRSPAGSNIVLRTGDGSTQHRAGEGADRAANRTTADIQGLDLSGDVFARPMTAAIRLKSVDGRCDVVTGDGSITIDGRSISCGRARATAR